jgi:tetratricopeptide (TPR) repeat protein
MSTDLRENLARLVDERLALESQLQQEPGDRAPESTAAHERQYGSLQRRLAALLKDTADEQDRVAVMLEMMRILENRLVYLQNFNVDANPDNRMLAQLVTRFIDEAARRRSDVLSSLESTYFRAIAALYAGDDASAREGFAAACASEESDEANDIKYKSYVILGNLSHEDADYAKARDLHEQSLRYSANDNVTAQALALKALNAYALHEQDEAQRLFEEALALFDESKPFFNSYFHRNALSFCGAIAFDRHELERAESFYRRVVDAVDHGSFDYFDALSHLGRIEYSRKRYDEAVTSFEKAVSTHRFSENEYVVDTWFWIARCHLHRNDAGSARKYLEKVAASDVRYEKKPQAVELLQRIA